MSVCATLDLTGTQLREKKSNTKSHQVVHVCMGGAPIEPIAMEICTFFKGYQRNQSHQFWWLYVEGFGFYKGSNLSFSHRKLT
jgi:hypothetical protein